MGEAKERKALMDELVVDLVNRFGNEIHYIFQPRYTTVGEGRRQTNPYVNMTDREQNEAIVAAITMLLGQIAASTVMTDQRVDMNLVYSEFSKKIRKFGDQYQVQFLKEKELQDEIIANQRSQRGNVGSVPAGTSVGSEGTSDQSGEAVPLVQDQ